MAATLANGGKNPVTKKQVIDAEHVPQILAVMATAGLYDDSGMWLYRTRAARRRAASAAASSRCRPGKFGIAAFSPPLDAAGNSVRGAEGDRSTSSSSSARTPTRRRRAEPPRSRVGLGFLWTPGLRPTEVTVRTMRAGAGPRRWAVAAGLALGVASAAGAQTAATYELNDSHFHLTNYVQEGPDVREFLTLMGDEGRPRGALRHPAPADLVLRELRRLRADLLPRRPTRRSTTTPSPTPTSRTQYLSLSKEEQARFDPMITGFNPADMYAVDHIRRVLADLPGRVRRHRRVHDPQGVRVLEGRGRHRRASPTRRSTGSSTSPPRRARRAAPQRHRRAVREGGRRARLPRRR